MILRSFLVLWFIFLARLIVAVNVISTEESGGRDFLRSLNEKSAEIASNLVSAQWKFETNHTENAKKELVQITSKAIQNAKLRFQNVINNYPWKSFSNPGIRRQLKLFSEIGTLALPDKEYHQFQKIISDLHMLQQNTTICDYYNKTKCDLHLYPDIQEKLESSQNSGELSYIWTEWKKATQKEFTKLLNSYVKLCNQAAVLNNYRSFREYSLRNIEANDIKHDMITLWEDIRPLYSQIHAYVRRKLRNIYGEKIVPKRGPIPAHLLGNIWSENWLGVAQRVIPFPQQDNFNFTAILINQGHTPDSIRKLAEDFLASMNFSIPPELWLNASELPFFKNSENCHPKIFNFYADGVRIKVCEKISLKEYLEDIRLLTKAEYMLQYSGQPFVYQTPADPGLEEAINNVMTISASTFDNLIKLGLFKGEITEEIRLNRLFKLALEKLTSISFLLVQEFWRWDVYGGKAVEETICIVNDLREKFQGISTFTKELTFDPGGIGSAFSKLSLAHHFLGYFLEFQIYESICQMSKPSQHENDLNECNLSGNVEAGEALRKIMSLGSSKTLTESFSSALGLSKINSKSILKYFDPLMRWLTKENANEGEYIGWEGPEKSKANHKPPKTRRKRSLEDYQSEMKDVDPHSTSSGEPDRFQRLVYKRLTNNEGSGKNKRKSTGDDQMLKNVLVGKHRLRRAEEIIRRQFDTKNRRSLIKNNKNIRKRFEDLVAKEKGGVEIKKVNKLTSRSKKRHSDFDSLEQSHDNSRHLRALNNKEENTYEKRSYNFPYEKEYKSTGSGSGSYGDNNDAGIGNGKSKIRLARGAQKQRRYDSEAGSAQSHQLGREKENCQCHKERPVRDVQWHSDTKKDISRLLHSFGFAVENDDKDKIKELKKKLKGDSNSDLKSSLASKEGSYENMIDYGRLKSSEIRDDAGEDKGTNKLWSVKSYLTDSAKILQSSPSLDKKESLLTTHLTSSMLSHSHDEKSIGKKEAIKSGDASLASGKDGISESRQSESGYRHMNIDLPSLQTLLQKADMNSYGQKQIFTVTPEISEVKSRNDVNQVYEGKAGFNKYGNSYLYKYAPFGDVLQYKDKKEFRDVGGDNENKSPYIIILGQMAPDMREKLHDKGVNFLELDKQALLQNGALAEERKSEKRSRASEQIYIVPIDLKNTHNNLIKTNHYAEHEHSPGHDLNTERDQESEEEQLHLDDNSKLEDNSNFYKSGKESPSEFILSWNNEKNRKIVKRSKREHKKEAGDDKLKVVRIAPMKDSFLEGLLGKSLDQSNLDDKNVKILIHDALLNGNSDLSSALGSASPTAGSVSVVAPAMDQSQTASLQHSSSLSSLATSVLSALSPKGFSQVAKSANQHQDADLEEENLKENVQPLVGGKKEAKLHAEDDSKTLIDVDPAAKGDDACCKKIILTPCPPRCPCPCPSPCPSPSPSPCPSSCPCPCPLPYPCPCPPPCPSPGPCPDDCCKRIIQCPPVSCRPECDLCCKKPSECSLVNCQFKITKAKKPHERLTIMIYDRINPPAELPEPYDALAVISEILQRIQCCSCKPCQLTEEDPDYPANDNTDQLKGNPNQSPENKVKIQELSGEIPILGSESPEEDETDDSPQMQSSPNSADEDKYQPKDKATPAIDQLTVFNKDKLKPVLIELRKIDDIIKKRSQKE